MSIALGIIGALALVTSIVRAFKKADTGTSAEWAMVSGLFFIASVLAAPKPE